MRRFFTVCLATGLCAFSCGAAAQGLRPGKGLKVDTFLEKAILETGESALDRAAPAEQAAERDIAAVPAVPPVFEEEGDIETEEDAPPAAAPPPPEDTGAQTPQEPSEPRTIGLTAGGMRFLPQITIRESWTNNLYATETDEAADFVTSIMPRLHIDIPDIRHDVAFDASYEARHHITHDSENQQNIKSRFGGALNAVYGLSVPFSFAWNNTQEQREDDLAGQQSREPLGMDDVRMEGGLRFKPGGFGLALIGHYRRQRYADGEARTGGAPIIRSDANRDATWLEFNTTFALDPANSLVLQGTFGDRDYQGPSYDNATAAFSGPQRSSGTWSGMLGWMFTSPELYGHIRAGVDDHNYRDARLENVREFVGDMEVTHPLDARTSLNLQLARSVFEDVEIVDAITKSRMALYMDRQVAENFLIAAGLDYKFLAFHDPGGRTDESWEFRAIADYFLSDLWAIGAEYSHTVRDSSAAGLDFSRSLFELRLRGRL